MSCNGGVRAQADSPRRTDKDFFSHIPTIFITNALFGLNYLAVVDREILLR
jgi:hypothetical protein